MFGPGGCGCSVQGDVDDCGMGLLNVDNVYYSLDYF